MKGRFFLSSFFFSFLFLFLFFFFFLFVFFRTTRFFEIVTDVVLSLADRRGEEKRRVCLF